MASPVPSTYSALPSPLIDGGDDIYLSRELDRIGAVIANHALFIPQVAIAAPLRPFDGMIRLSRSPWRPVAGTTTDAWVFYDGTIPGWALL